MSQDTEIPLKFSPGINRDNPYLTHNQYIDALWTRFYNGYPRKIGGLEYITDLGSGGADTIVGMFMPNYNTYTTDAEELPIYYLYAGNAKTIYEIRLKQESSGLDYKLFGVITDLGPNLEDDKYLLWNFAEYVSLDHSSYILAHASKNRQSVSTTRNGAIYYKKVGDPMSRFTPVKNEADEEVVVSGGILSLSDGIVFAYGNDGVLRFANGGGAGGAPIVFKTDDVAVICNSKIVSLVSRGGGGSGTYNLLAFTSNQVYNVVAQMSSNPETAPFLTVVSSPFPINSSVISSGCICCYNNVVYWLGADKQMYMFTGVVQTLPNKDNRVWFFNKLNWASRSKIIAMANPAYNEIIWLFPADESTENNWALIYNIEEGTWYDTPFPPTLFNENKAEIGSCLSTSLIAYNLVSYKDYIFFFDKGAAIVQKGGNKKVIDAYARSSLLQLRTRTNTTTFLKRLDPDFIVPPRPETNNPNATMYVRILGQRYPQSPLVEVVPKVYFNEDTEKIDGVYSKCNYYSFEFGTNDNVLYQFGTSMLTYETGDSRP